MTNKEREKWRAGQTYWYEYQQVNKHEDTGIKPTKEGIKKLSESLKIAQAHLRRCISFYLWN